jgi:hypothetical protein
VVWLERIKIGEEPLSVFKIFNSFFYFKEMVTENAALQRKGM